MFKPEGNGDISSGKEKVSLDDLGTFLKDEIISELKQEVSSLIKKGKEKLKLERYQKVLDLLTDKNVNQETQEVMEATTEELKILISNEELDKKALRGIINEHINDFLQFVLSELSPADISENKIVDGHRKEKDEQLNQSLQDANNLYEKAKELKINKTVENAIEALERSLMLLEKMNLVPDSSKKEILDNTKKDLQDKIKELQEMLEGDSEQQLAA